jgi:predicted TIM-barrel fold metal-dependent hydrolase
MLEPQGAGRIDASRWDCHYRYHPQLPALTALARAFPEQPIVCNHLAMPLGVGPFAAERGWDGAVSREWRENVKALAAQPNVYMKLGGLPMPVCGLGFERRAAPPTSEELAAVMAPYVNFAIDQFGAARCMFESNFPVDKASCSYTVLWNAFKRVTATRGCGAEETAALFGGTAKGLYKL